MSDIVVMLNEISYNQISITISNLIIKGVHYEVEPYEVNLITGDINKKGKSRVLKPMFNNDSNKVPYVNLRTINKKTLRVYYYKLLTYIRMNLGYIKEVDYQYIINKHLNYLDGHISNLLYLNGLEAVYYRDRENFNKYIKNRVCIIDPGYSVYDAINDGLVVVKPINIETNYKGEFFIDTNGIIVNNNSGAYVNKCLNKSGYLMFSCNIDGNVYSGNVINILGRTFLKCTNNTVYGFKDSDIPRSNADLINIMSTTRKELTKKYHKNNSDHYDKYLKNHNMTNTKNIIVDGKLFKSYASAAKYVVEEEKQLGITRSLPSVISLISLRVNKKLKNNNRKIYNKYTVIV